MRYLTYILFLTSPLFVRADGYLGGEAGLDGFFGRLNGFISNVLIPFIFTVALLVFIYGMYRWFIQGGGSETDREKGKQLVIWSIAGFVLMVSIWGIVTLIATGLGLTGGSPDTLLPTPPTL